MPKIKTSRVFEFILLPLMVGAPVAFMLFQQFQKAGQQNAQQPLKVDFNGFVYLVGNEEAQNTPDFSVDHYTRLVDEKSDRLGPLHPETLIFRNNLAGAVLAAGRAREAEELQRTLLADMEKSIGPLHPDTFRCRFNLALNLRSQGNLPAARKEMELVYAGWSQVLGEGHPRTQSALLVLQNLKNTGH